jgi:MOSC domain-containing protein YiiM
MSQFPHAGTIAWIGVRPAPGVAMRVVPSVEAIEGRGLAGDRTAERARRASAHSARQVTFIQAEHLTAIGALLGQEIDPALTRRNIVVAGVNLLSLKGHVFSIGGARFEMTGDCHPCTAMETALGLGGYNAMRGMGGITAIVLETGLVSVGDALTVNVAHHDVA